MKQVKQVIFLAVVLSFGFQAACSSPSTNIAEREAVKAALSRIVNKQPDEKPGFFAGVFGQKPFLGIWVGPNRKNGQQALKVGDKVDLRGLDIHSIPGAQFQNAYFGHSVLLGHSKLPHANFTGADLNKTNLNDSDLNHAKFENTTIQDVYFTNSDLSDSKWRGARLFGGQFDFTNANLAGMDGLQYPETEVSGVSFRGAKNMPFDQKCAAQQKGALGITYSFWENFRPCPNPHAVKQRTQQSVRKKSAAMYPGSY